MEGENSGVQAGHLGERQIEKAVGYGGRRFHQARADRKLKPWRDVSKAEQAAVKAESCGDCGTYLKIMYQEKDPKVEAVADDLASLVLDARMEQEGFARSSINPFMFPGEGE